MKSENGSGRRNVMGNRLPNSETVYFCRMIVVYVIIITSIVNLSLQNGKNELWITLLSSANVYALPSPTLKATPMTTYESERWNR